MWTRAGLRVFARPTAKIKRYSTMATPFNIKVEPQNSGLLGLKLGKNEASKATDLLQKDLEVPTSHYLDAHIHQRLTLFRIITSSSMRLAFMTT
jgi:hypothetical protein